MKYLFLLFVIFCIGCKPRNYIKSHSEATRDMFKKPKILTDSEGNKYYVEYNYKYKVKLLSKEESDK